MYQNLYHISSQPSSSLYIDTAITINFLLQCSRQVKASNIDTQYHLTLVGVSRSLRSSHSGRGLGAARRVRVPNLSASFAPTRLFIMARRTTALVVACTARLVASQAPGSGFQDVPDVQLFQGRDGAPANCQGVSGSTAMCLSNPCTASNAPCANACLLTNSCWVALCRIGTQSPDWNTQGSKLAAGATIAWRIPDCSPLNARGEL